MTLQPLIVGLLALGLGYMFVSVVVRFWVSLPILIAVVLMAWVVGTLILKFTGN